MDLMLLIVLGCVFGVVLACMAASKREKREEREREEREKMKREEREKKEKEREERETEETRERGIGLPALIVFVIVGYLIAALLLGGKDMIQEGTEETSQIESTDWMQP